MTRSGRPGRPWTPAPERLGIAWSDPSVRLLVLAAFVVARRLARPRHHRAVRRGRRPGVCVLAGRRRRSTAGLGCRGWRSSRLGYLLFLAAVGVLAFVAAEKAGKELTDLSSGGHDIISSALHKLFGDTIVSRRQHATPSRRWR